MALDHTANGVYAIAATPFLPDGRLDTVSVDRMVDFYLEAGVTGLTILGIMGEAPKLDAAESLAVSEQIVRRATVPVIVGVSAPGFAAMRSLARSVMEAGAAGVMIAPPPSLRTDDQITTYYRQAIEAIGSDIPFVIQDYPLTLTVVMTPKVIRQIVTDNPSCVMLKHEDWPGLEKISTLRLPARRHAARDLDPDRQWRPLPRFRDGARRRWRHDRLCLPGHAGRCRAPVQGRRARQGA
jgi:4-hydroxy-tetrahydrodipicolinate synthase